MESRQFFRAVSKDLWSLAARMAPIGIAAVFCAASVPMVANANASNGMTFVDVIGTEFRIHRVDGAVIAGPALVGAELAIAGPDGMSSLIRIESVEADKKTSGVYLYGLSTLDSSGVWKNLCDADFEGQRKGFPMRGALAADGEYHPEAPGFSLTCTSGAQAKCVRLGYKPWESGNGGVSTLALYRACMRMVRADYCGDGRSWTRDGTSIDVRDVVGIQRFETTMPLEAGWSQRGAVCVRHTRKPDLLTLNQLASYCPKLAETTGPLCTESASEALIFNKSK